MTKIKVEGTIEVIEGQLDCIKSMIEHDLTASQSAILQSLRIIVLACDEATKD
jgi:DNA-binding FrmR family transcriptional regulator